MLCKCKLIYHLFSSEEVLRQMTYRQCYFTETITLSLIKTVLVLYQHRAIGLEINQEFEWVVFASRLHISHNYKHIKERNAGTLPDFYTICTWPLLNRDCTDRPLLKCAIEKINIYIDWSIKTEITLSGTPTISAACVRLIEISWKWPCTGCGWNTWISV